MVTDSKGSLNSKHIFWLIAGVAAILLVYFLRDILTPFVWASVTAFALNPVIAFLSGKTRVHRRAYVVILFLLVIGLIYSALHYLLPAAFEELRELPSILASLRANLRQHHPALILGLNTFPFQQGLFLDANSIAGMFQAHAGAVASVVASSILKIVIFFVALFYLMWDAPKIRDYFSFIGKEYLRPDSLELWSQINKIVSKFIRGQMIVIACMWILAYISMGLILHLQFAVALSLLTGILELFPVIGPLVAWTLALSASLIQGHHPYGWDPITNALAVLFFYALVRLIQDYIVIPNVIGRVLRLHPVVVLFSVLIGGTLWGLTGAFIAVPGVAVIRTVLEYWGQKNKPGSLA